MPRVKRSVPSRNYRKKILKLHAKGMRGRSKNCFSVAIQKIEKGLGYAYRDRKVKKRDFRSIWIVRINAALREIGLKYSQFIHMSKDLEVNRKMLSYLATDKPDLFKKLVLQISQEKNKDKI